MKLLQILKGMRTVALIIVVAFVALLAFAPTVSASDKPADEHAADDHSGSGIQDGQAGDHHAPAAQDAMLHWSNSIMFWEYVTFGLVILVLGFERFS